MFQNGVTGRVRFRVLDPLKKPLISTSALTKAGYRVVLEGGDAPSFIEEKSSGNRFRVYERGGVFAVPLWLRHTAPFPRQAPP